MQPIITTTDGHHQRDTTALASFACARLTRTQRQVKAARKDTPRRSPRIQWPERSEKTHPGSISCIKLIEASAAGSSFPYAPSLDRSISLHRKAPSIPFWDLHLHFFSHCASYCARVKRIEWTQHLSRSHVCGVLTTNRNLHATAATNGDPPLAAAASARGTSARMQRCESERHIHQDPSFSRPTCFDQLLQANGPC